jgi:hypothetical protein
MLIEPYGASDTASGLGSCLYRGGSGGHDGLAVRSTQGVLTLTMGNLAPHPPSGGPAPTRNEPERAGRVIVNPISGERIVIRHSGAETGGELLSFDLYLPPGGHVPASHVHPIQGATWRVTAGRSSSHATSAYSPGSASGHAEDRIRWRDSLEVRERRILVYGDVRACSWRLLEVRF